MWDTAVSTFRRHGFNSQLNWDTSKVTYGVRGMPSPLNAWD